MRKIQFRFCVGASRSRWPSASRAEPTTAPKIHSRSFSTSVGPTRILKFALISTSNGIKSADILGSKPNPMKGTKGVLKLDDASKISEQEKHWFVRLLNQQEETMTLEVTSPPDCPVGIWNIQIETTQVNSTANPTTFDYGNDVYILFNPWNTSKSSPHILFSNNLFTFQATWFTCRKKGCWTNTS